MDDADRTTRSSEAIPARGATCCVPGLLGEMWIKALERGEGPPRDLHACVAIDLAK